MTFLPYLRSLFDVIRKVDLTYKNIHLRLKNTCMLRF